MTEGIDPITKRFAKGNKLGKGGNPQAAKAASLRAAAYSIIKADDIKGILAKMIELGKNGDVKAAKVVFDTVGLVVKHNEITFNNEPVKLYSCIDETKI